MAPVSLICHTPIVIIGQHVNWSSFHNEMSKTTSFGVSLIISEQVLARCWHLLAFMKATNLLLGRCSGYLFIGPNRGQNNIVHSLPVIVKWVPTFLVTFLLLLNSHVRIYVDSTKIMSVRRNGGKARQLSKLVFHGMWWAHTMVRWRRLAGTSTMVR